jgi:hypothetical protein
MSVTQERRKLLDSRTTVTAHRYSYWVGCRRESDAFLPNTARITTHLLEKFRWKYLAHPPYSPYLESNNLHLFGPLEYHFKGKHF